MGIIPEGFDMGENIHLMIFLSMVSTTEVLNRGLYMEFIDATNRQRNSGVEV